jgi:hypothetical protein
MGKSFFLFFYNLPQLEVNFGAGAVTRRGAARASASQKCCGSLWLRCFKLHRLYTSKSVLKASLIGKVGITGPRYYVYVLLL